MADVDGWMVVERESGRGRFGSVGGWDGRGFGMPLAGICATGGGEREGERRIEGWMDTVCWRGDRTDGGFPFFTQQVLRQVART